MFIYSEYWREEVGAWQCSYTVNVGEGKRTPLPAHSVVQTFFASCAVLDISNIARCCGLSVNKWRSGSVKTVRRFFGVFA